MKCLFFQNISEERLKLLLVIHQKREREKEMQREGKKLERNVDIKE